MAKKKQMTQVAVLAVLLIGLVVVAIIQFSGKKAPAPAAAPATTPAATTSTAATPQAVSSSQESKGALGWVTNDPAMLQMMVNNVKRGRNPFIDRLTPIVAIAVNAGNPGAPTPTPRSLLPRVDLPLPTFPPTSPLPGPKAPAVEPALPPIPPFVLCGVIAMPHERMATIKLNEKYFIMLEGETVPGMNWKVSRIFPTSVEMTDNTQKYLIKMSGGDSI